jgi:predicted metal-dependent phosphoesterase TrpH
MLEKYYQGLKDDPRDVRVDLHVHSNASDGTWPPEELVKHVKAAGIRIFALTDHNTINNVSRTSALARAHGVFLIPGVEIDSFHEGYSYHILGLGIDIENSRLRLLLKDQEERMEMRDKGAIAFLESKYPHVSAEDYDRYEDDHSRGGWKALNYCIDKKLCTDYREFFALFPGDLPFFVPSVFHPAEDVISVIKKAGGCAVLAHPGASFYNPDYRAVLSDMLELGIQGIECYHIENGEEVTRYALKFCAAHGLLVTGGSDCHGTFVPERWLGNPEVRLSDLVL